MPRIDGLALDGSALRAIFLLDEIQILFLLLFVGRGIKRKRRCGRQRIIFVFYRHRNAPCFLIRQDLLSSLGLRPRWFDLALSACVLRKRMEQCVDVTCEDIWLRNIRCLSSCCVFVFCFLQYQRKLGFRLLQLLIRLFRMDDNGYVIMRSY